MADEATAKIDKDGHLWVLRAGKWKCQTCPYSREQENAECGDWCPLFSKINIVWQEGLPPRWAVDLGCANERTGLRDIAEDLREQPEADKE